MATLLVLPGKDRPPFQESFRFCRCNAVRAEMAQSHPPDYGRRLLMTTIDERARANYARPFASIPVSENAADGFRDISYRRFANAINRCAYWIAEFVGVSQCFETLTYLGPNDLRYQILCMAAAKTGHVVCCSFKETLDISPYAAVDVRSVADE